jgi:hypothetical protein
MRTKPWEVLAILLLGGLLGFGVALLRRVGSLPDKEGKR